MTRRTLRLLSGPAAVAAVALFASSASAGPLVQTVVFAKGDSGYNTFRIPAIVTAANGNLLAFAEGRKNSASDTGDIDMVLRRSSDGGLTWGPLQVIGDKGADTFGNPAPVLDVRNGRLTLLSTHNPATVTSSRTVWQQQSDDNGATWTAAKEITNSVRDPAANWYATGPGHAIQLTRGAHAGRLLVAVDENTSSTSGALSIYSDDGGLTWKRGTKVVSAGSTYLNESTEVELVDGRVQINARNKGGTTRSRTVAYSSDAGLTFGPKSQAAGLIDPTVQASILSYSALDRGGIQNRILFSNPNDPAARVNMTVKSSFDETLTWDAGKRIFAGPSAYSDLVAYGTGRAGLLYENGESSPYERITFASWGDGWLDDDSIMQLDFNEAASGVASIATGAIRDSRGYGLHGTAIGLPTYVAGDPKNGDGRALRFTAGSDCVRVVDTGISPLDMTAGQSFTLEVDFRTTDHGTGGANESGPLISKDVGSNQPSYWLRVEDGVARFLVSDANGNTASVVSPMAVNDGNWHHISAMRDSATDELRMYVDHALAASAIDTTTGTFANTNVLLIGAFNNPGTGTKQFIGDIDYVALRYGAFGTAVAPVVPEPGIVAIALAATCLRRRRRS